MHGRTLPPIAITEFTAEVLQEAIEWHLGRLQKAMNAERDRANRSGWALQMRRRCALHSLMWDLSRERDDMGPMPSEHAEELEHFIQRAGRHMPRSAANAEVLKVERAARLDAEAKRKAASRKQRERLKRIFGKAEEP